MPTLKIPTPLRPYADGQAEITVQGQKVGEALDDLTGQHPDLRQHLFNETGKLRPFVNLFINDEDIRFLDGVETPITEDDRLMIIPSIAGGLSKVDHSALKTNQAFIIGLNIIAFILNAPLLSVVVTGVMIIGTSLKQPGFGFIYKRALKPLGWVKSDLLVDNPEPHRFAQSFGAVVMAGGVIALFAGASVLGWGLVWLVVALAALNLFVGFCVGCAVYYWLNRLNVPGFAQSPPKGISPGMRPKIRA